MGKIENNQKLKKRSNVSEDPPKNKSSLWPQFFTSITISLGSMMIGFSSAYSAPALASMAEDPLLKQTNLNQRTWIGSLMPLFAAIGGLVGGPLIEKFGRKYTQAISGFPFIVSFLLIAFAKDAVLIMVGRSLTGFTVGILSVSSPIYLGETIEAKYRGILGLLPTTVGNTGLFLCYAGGLYLNWSNLAFLGAVLPVPFLLCAFILPETPRWYASKGQSKKAVKALQWLRGKEDVASEFKEIEANIKAKEQKDKVSKVQYLKPILIIVFLKFFQQMSGISAVVFYSVEIFMESGSSMNSNLQSVILGLVNVISTAAATLLIDRVGRKVLLYWSSSIMTITLAFLGLYFMSKNLQEITSDELNVIEWYISKFNFEWIPLLCLVVYMVGFSLGFGPVPWIMMGEILPTKVKGTGAAIGSTFTWGCSFIIITIFPPMIILLGSHRTYWLFSLISCLALIFVKLFVPETKGKSLEQIEQSFAFSKFSNSNKKRTKHSKSSKTSTGVIKSSYGDDCSTSTDDCKLTNTNNNKQ